MWHTGVAHLERARQHQFRHKRAKAVWCRPPTAPYQPTPLTVNPFWFAYATARTSVVGSQLGLRGVLSSLGLAMAAQPYLVRRSSAGLVVHPDVHRLKDFVGTSLRGTIGAAMAYLEMQQLGYPWFCHWEDCVLGRTAGPHPDFVFARNSDVCLVDAKGSLGGSIDTFVKSAWVKQIYPHRNRTLSFGGKPTEGRVIGTQLSQIDPAHLVTAYDRWPPGPSSRTGSSARGSLAARASVQYGGFIRAFQLVGMHEQAEVLANTMERPVRMDEVADGISDESRAERLGRIEIRVGPVRGVVWHQKQPWSMEFFCLQEFVDHVMARQAGDASPSLWRAEPRNPPQDVGQLAAVVVQSADGVGARFRRLG